MRLIKPIAAFYLAAAFLFAACQKEYSIENGGKVVIGEGTAEGTLGGDPSNCANAQVIGAYGEGLATDSTNKVVIEMNFTAPGTYNISTDTVNGFYFNNSGSISGTGVKSITLIAGGTPATAGSYIFTVKFKGSVCSFTVDVLTVAPSNGSDYFPITQNSFWKFASSDPSASPEDTLRNTSSGQQFTVNGAVYNMFTSTNDLGTDSLFFSKGGGEYHQFGDLDVAGAATNVVAADFIFLKDNVPVGTTWESPEGDADVNGVSVKLKLSFTVSEKNANVQLGNVVFKNVIKVITSEQVKLPAGYTTILTYETWYAKGIGIINLTAAPPLYGYQVEAYQVF